MKKNVLLVISALLLWCACGVVADLNTHKYVDGEAVMVWANKVGPYPNPHETYSYYALPFCAPQSLHQTTREGLGEALQGYELVRMPFSFSFCANEPHKLICEVQLTPDIISTFRNAVARQYWYQLFVDDLPVWGMVGEKVQLDDSESPQTYVYTHKRFELSFNGDRVIEVNMTSENPKLLTDNTSSLKFSYSVHWSSTSTPFESRFDKYLEDDFFEHQIHWFSVFNSMMMMVFLCGLVAIIMMRTLRRDYQRYAMLGEEDAEEADVDDSGWKQVYGDVFRAPRALPLLSMCIGCGCQLAVLSLSAIAVSAFGADYAERGHVLTNIVLLYCVCSLVGGYASGSHYSRNRGKRWQLVLLGTSSLLPLTLCALGGFLDIIAMSYSSQSSIPITTIISLVCLWLFVCVPLTFVGTLLGRHFDGASTGAPVRVNQVPRQIPLRSPLTHRYVYALAGGLLPFGSIFIEMYFIFSSFWHYKYYYVYGFLLQVFAILLMVIVCVNVVLTYFLLNSEDYRWHWTAFTSSASTAFYVALYSLYYFFRKTRMHGVLQIAFYFGYMTILCISLALLCGSIGFLAAEWFVRKIYANVKID